jgi:hypothetical protein
MSLTSMVMLAAVAANGLLAGTSVDQSVKQLPARKRIGAVAYSAFAEAADLRNGIPLYAVLGIGAALLSLSAAVLGWRLGTHEARLPAVLAGVLAVLHSAVTSRAAPTMFSQRRVRGDEAALAHVFDRFARWQGVRCALQLANFFALLWLWTSLSTIAHAC